MINVETQKKNFKNHVATLTDCGNIKVLDFKNPESSNYRIRFIFEEDYCRCHISGDLGSLVATNYNNMTYEGFKDFVHNVGYFEGKIDCCQRSIYVYDEEFAEKQLREKLEEIAEYAECDDEIDIDDVVYDMMCDFGDAGFGSIACAALNEYDSDCWEYISDLGKEETGILELYMLAFELATQQLKERESQEALDETDETGFTIKVSSCRDCPWRTANTGGKVPHYCRKIHGSMDDADFPKYCPYKQEKAKEVSA